MKSLIKGTLEWGPSSYNIPGCVCTSNNMFRFDRRHCNKLAGPGVSLNIAEERKSRDESTMNLTVGDWIIIDGDDETEPLWLGRVLSNPEWAGQGVKKNESGKQMKFANGTVLQRNDIGVYIMWYEKIDTESDALEYHVSRTITEPGVQNNEYLICSGFEMHRVVGGSNPNPRGTQEDY